MKAVIDASVALKWQFEEEEASGPATLLLKDFVERKIEVITITLFSYEILSGINVAISTKRMSEAIGKKALNYLAALGIEERPFEGLIGEIFRMARKYNLSTYDCAYVVLAKKERCNLYTGDGKLFHVAGIHLPWVKWIGNYCRPNE